LTSWTLDEFEQLSPPFEAAFQAHMARWRLDGNRRTARRYNGKKKDHTVKKVWLVKAPLAILFLSDTDGGRTHDKPIADATPYPLPAGSGLLQDLGFLGFVRHEVAYTAVMTPKGGHNLVCCHQYPTQTCGWSNPAV
jgi:hypothetical protein